MNTLSIPEIFANLDFYQENYLSILSNIDQYQTPVAGAYLNVWPFAHQELYLGDLLQLWFSQKWLINQKCHLRAEHKDDGHQFPLQREQDLYLYQLTGSALAGSNHAWVWSVSEAKALPVRLDSAFRYLCEYKGTSKPKISSSDLIAALKKSV
jgi:hypothetical protein